MESVRVDMDGSGTTVYPFYQKYNEWPRDELIDHNVSMCKLPNSIRLKFDLIVKTYSKVCFYIENIYTKDGVVLETEEFPPFQNKWDHVYDDVDCSNTKVYYTISLLMNDKWCEVVINEQIMRTIH